MSNSVENLSFKFEMEAEAAAKKNIIGMYLATWCALQVALNLKQQLNALALIPYPKIMLACARGWSLPLIMLISWPMLLESSNKRFLKFFKSFQKPLKKLLVLTGLGGGTTTLVNESDNAIKFSICNDFKCFHEKTLEANKETEINVDYFKSEPMDPPLTVIVTMNEKKRTFNTQHFITHNKLTFKMDNEGNLIVAEVDIRR